MTEIVTLTATGLTVASKAQPALWDLLKKRIVSLNDVKEASAVLGQAIEKLVCQKIDYANNVNSHCLKVPSETYLHWLEVVEEIEKKANELLKGCGEKSKIAFIKRPALMEKIRTLDEKVEKLKVEGDQLESKLFVDPKLEHVIRNNETPDIKKFGSLQEPLEKILVLLQNDKVYKLGIYGPLGIGKTTIMWNLNNHEEVARSFDIVIWVKASMEGNKENISMERIQQVICRRLKLDLEGNTDHEEVKRVISRVMSYKKYLLLLDDVKEPPDLEKIGIPANKNGSKVVLTTRLHHVCSLTVDRMIRVSYLSPDESWKMFQDVMKQPKLIKDSKIGPLAWRVCKECSGLPLLVEKVASTFRLKNNEHDWVEGLNSWRMWPETERQGIEEMHNMFKFCYDDLDNDDQKKCFSMEHYIQKIVISILIVYSSVGQLKL